MPPFDRPETHAALVRLPDHAVAEMVDGELHASPRPAPRHAVAYARATGLLGSAFDPGRTGPGGWWILAEPELHLGPDVLVPDLTGWRRTRMPRIPDTAFFPLAPDWICEVLSPSTAALDRTQKLGIYAREGVGCSWLSDPIARTLEILRLEEGAWPAVVTHAGEAAIRVESFDAVEFSLGELQAD